MSEKPNHAISDLSNALEVIQSPRLSEIYTTTLRLNTPTVANIADNVDCALSTVYRYVNRLEEMGFVERIETSQPYRYESIDICIKISTSGGEYLIEPLLIMASARRVESSTLDRFVENNGVDGLAIALEVVEETIVSESSEAASRAYLDMPEQVLDELRDLVVENKVDHSVNKSAEINTDSADKNSLV